MPERLFLFMQLEFPWELGPPDGRYLLRTRDVGGRAAIHGGDGARGAQPERVVVLNTLGALRHAGRSALGLPGVGSSRRARRARETTPEPAPVATSRATIVDPVSVSAETQAQAWLSGIDGERETLAAVAVLNRVLFSHRIAAADPHTHEVAPEQALVIRAGWGDGEHVAEGLWLHAHELPWVQSTRSRRRAAALRPQERVAELLGARSEELLCEELALRARLDIDEGRPRHAAIELDGALSAALFELPREGHPALAPRLEELRRLRGGVIEAARIALPSEDVAIEHAGETIGTVEGTEASDHESSSREPDEEIVRHALERLEAALRARTAGGFTSRD